MATTLYSKWTLGDTRQQDKRRYLKCRCGLERTHWRYRILLCGPVRQHIRCEELGDTKDFLECLTLLQVSRLTERDDGDLTAIAHGVVRAKTEFSSLLSRFKIMAGLIPLARRPSVALKSAGSNVDWANTRPVTITPSETPERNLMLAEVLCAYTELQMQPQNRAGSGARKRLASGLRDIICGRCSGMDVANESRSKPSTRVASRSFYASSLCMAVISFGKA